MEKKTYIKPQMTRIDLEDKEVVGMAVSPKTEEPLINNPCAVGGVGGLGGTPLFGAFGS